MAVWLETVDVSEFFRAYRAQEISFSAFLAEVVGTFKEHGWDQEDTLLDLAIAETESEFDYYWDRLYDAADEYRVWIKTF